MTNASSDSAKANMKLGFTVEEHGDRDISVKNYIAIELSDASSYGSDIDTPLSELVNRALYRVTLIVFGHTLFSVSYP